MHAGMTWLLLLTNLATTLFMIGVIWMVQVVHYPLFAGVGSDALPAYEKRHRKLITCVVGPPMLIEAVTAVLMLWFHPASVPEWCCWLGVFLLAAIWLSTALIQVPCHEELGHRFDPAIHRRLVLSNWIRTLIWTLRGALLLWIVGWLLPQTTLESISKGTVEMAKLQPGDRAPDFTATSYDGKTVRLSDYLGKRALVLFFYPKNGTPVCTQEACAFRDSYEQFIDAGAEVIGVSSDSTESHNKFSAQHKLAFPLISDADGSLRQLFAVPKAFGMFPGRVTYVIDQNGVIRKIFSAQFASEEHVRQALASVNGADDLAP